MAFSEFTYPDVVDQFGFTRRPAYDLFAGVSPLAPSAGLRQLLPAFQRAAVASGTEKSRSECLISPLLVDVWDRYHGQVGLYSGVTFAADPANGLTGLCDFLLCRSPQDFVVRPPVLVAFEAKSDTATTGYGQCAAAMIGAQRYNQRLRADADPIYGCVTTGTHWRFASLSGTTFTMDLTEYNLSDADRILGILAHMLGPIPAAAAA